MAVEQTTVPSAEPVSVAGRWPKRVKTPTVIQMEAVECGAASLGIVLGYYGRIVPLEQLRVECGVTRDGSKAGNVCRAARKYGFIAKGYRKEPAALREMRVPMIVFWNFNHFLVLEGFKNGKVYINDPMSGPRVITEEEFDMSFTGVVLTFEQTADFKKGGSKPSLMGALRRRLKGSEMGLIFVLLASLLLVIPSLVIPTFTRMFVDDVLVRGRGLMTPILLSMGAVAFVIGFLTWLQKTYLLRLETKLALSMSSKFLWHVLRLPIEFFTQRYPGDLAARVGANDNVAKLISNDLATSLLGVILVAFYTTLMIQYDVLLTMIGVSIALLNLAALRYFSRVRKDANQKLLQEEGKLIGTSMSGLQIIETLKATGSESDFFSRWSGHHAKSINAEQNLGLSSQLLMIIPPLLTAVNTTAILIIGSLRVMEGHLTVGMLVAFQVLMTRFLLPIGDFVNLGSKLQEVEGDLNRLDDILRYHKDPQVDRVLPGEEDNSDYKLSGHVELRNVTFGYSKLGEPLIKNLNLTIAPGQCVALVGASGSGKSTISKLISGLYEPWEGEIVLDGVPRNDLPRTVVVNSLSMVDQDIFMFEGTVRSNITLWDDTIPLARVMQAARDAAIDQDVARLVGGYDHTVEEGGRNFSGGQRQRLEIARALVKDPTILVLDEATSALDAITEKVIADNLRRRGCTTIIVAHRLSTIRDADEIIVLEKGEIVQRGAHEDLIKRDGPYARLINAEAPTQKVNMLKLILDRLGE